MTVSPETTTFFVALQNSPGNGNSTFSYTLAVNSSACSSGGSPGNQKCSYTIVLPVGNDFVSILTASAASAPLDYSGSVPITVTATGPNSVTAALSPIIAKAIPAYAFEQINGGSVALPLVTASAYDANGDPVAISGDFPDGSPYSEIEVSQTLGLFETIAALNSGQGSYSVVGGPFSPGNPTLFPLAEHGGYILELGNGTTTFTTSVILSTPTVEFTQAEFPQLPTTGLEVPSTSNPIVLTCQFPHDPTTLGGLTSDPCPGTAPVTINVM